MAGTFPWGPAAISANTLTFTPALTILPADNYVAATVDLSALAAGISWSFGLQYRKSTTDPWVDYGSAAGTTPGGPAHDKGGNVVETGIRTGPMPNPGLTGRQVRGACLLGTSASLSGHVTTSAA